MTAGSDDFEVYSFLTGNIHVLENTFKILQSRLSPTSEFSFHVERILRAYLQVWQNELKIIETVKTFKDFFLFLIDYITFK